MTPKETLWELKVSKAGDYRKTEKTKSRVNLSEKNRRRRKHDIILKNQLSSFPVSL